jgi:squalene-associated FAD-dependent desaturase
MSTRGRRVAIVGGGWSGLAAAVDLTLHGVAVEVFEAGREPGGRARRLTLGGHTLDNGQHLLLGAYHATLDAMRTVGIDPERVLRREPLALRLTSAESDFGLRVPRYGGAAALVWALMTMRGIRAVDRMRAVAHAHALRRLPLHDQPAADWLSACGQPATVIERLWAPLCLAALNAPPARASARLFARVLGEAFRTPRASDLLFPVVDLGALFPRPAGDWLTARGQRVTTNTRVRTITRERDGWHLDCAQTRFDDVVLATDPATAARLLPDDAASQAHADRLRTLGAAPIATVYLDYGSDRPPSRIMSGRLDAPGQWVFDRRLTGSPGVLAVVVSGHGPHERMSRDQLARAVIGQLANGRRPAPAPRVLGVIREKRATFDPRPGIEPARVQTEGPLPGLWYAGDHVDTGLPATIEGAVRAGRRCAAAINEGSNRQ